MAQKQEVNIKHLIELIQEGDVKAFEELYMFLSGNLYKFLLMRTQDTDAVEDLLQDIFTDLWSGIDRFQYRSDGQFLGFLYIIAKRKLGKFYKKTKNSSHASLDDIQPSNTLNNIYEIDINHIDSVQILQKSMKEINKKYSEVLELRYWAGFSLSEIAEVLNLGESAVKMRHKRGLEKLETIIKEYER